MTRDEWQVLPKGTVLIYSAPERDYTNTICKVIDNNKGDLTLQIITPGDCNWNTWANNHNTADGWHANQAYKFSLYKLQSLEERIISKIKSLDSRWKTQQKQKGKHYEMLCL